MKVSHFYEKGSKKVNEDVCILNEKAGIFAAIDGATGLDGTPGHIASYAIGEVLRQAEKDMALFSVLKAANEKVQENTLAYYTGKVNIQSNLPSFSELSKTKRSSAALAAIKISSDRAFLEYVHAADCMLFLQYETGGIRMITYDLLQELDTIAIQKMATKRAEKASEGQDLQSLRKMVEPILLQNRLKANTLGGYSVIDGSTEALDFLERGRVSLNRVSKILLVSDGLFLPHKLEGTEPWLKTASLAFSEGIQGLVTEVKRREEVDPECKIYPRLKKLDDKTGILIELSS